MSIYWIWLQHCTSSDAVCTGFSPGPRPGTIASAIRQSWRQSLPDFYIPPIQEPKTDRQRDTKSDHSDGHFNIDVVQQIVTYNVMYHSMLVVMGIGKYISRCLIICPNLSKRYFDDTFPVLIDPVHFTPTTSTFSAVDDEKRVQG